jgi:tetratricopeptide (TPR) repeat protein
MFEDRYTDLYLWRTPWWFLRFCERTVGINRAIDFILISEVFGLVLLVFYGREDPLSPYRLISYLLIAPGVIFILIGIFAKHPEYETWLFERVVKSCDRGDFSKAKEIIERSMRQRQISEQLFQVLSVEIHYRAGEESKIVPELEKCLELIPDNSLVKFNLAIGQLLFDEDVTSIGLFLEGVPPVPSWQKDVQLSKSVAFGLLKLREGDFEEAERLLRESLEISRGFPKGKSHRPVQDEFIRGYLAVALGKQGKIEEARKNFEAAEVTLRKSGMNNMIREIELLISANSN